MECRLYSHQTYSELDFGISEGFRRNSKFGWVQLFRRMIMTLSRGHPKQYLHTQCAHTQFFKIKPSYAPPMPRSGL